MTATLRATKILLESAPHVADPRLPCGIDRGIFAQATKEILAVWIISSDCISGRLQSGWQPS